MGKECRIMTSLTQTLTAILARPIDDATRTRACAHLADWLACAALGAATPPGRAIIEYGQTLAAGPSFAVGCGARQTDSAAFVNGGLGNIMEIDDLHRTSIVHPGDVVIPAALALAEREKVDGPALLDAMVRGYEAAIRIGSAAGTSHYANWYNTATCGVFGATAAASSILALDARKTVDALGQAGMQAAGLWQCRHEPTFGKHLAAARGAQAGVIGADLAAIGYPGPSEILEGPQGFFTATAPGADPSRVVAGADDPWRIFEVSFKPWPSCRHTHPAVEAALALVDALDGRDVASVTVTTYAQAIAFCDKPDAATPDDARFSLQHCVALALARGRLALEDFEPSELVAPDVVALRSRVAVEEDPEMSAAFPERYATSVAIRFADGGTAEREIATAKGDPENPMTDAERREKFDTVMAAVGLDRSTIDGLWTEAHGLPSRDRLDPFTAALTAALPDRPSAVLASGDQLDEARQAAG